MLLSAVVFSIGCLNCFKPGKQFKTNCKVTEVKAALNPHDNAYTFTKVAIDGQDTLIKLKTLKQEQLLIQFKLEDFKKEVYLTISALDGGIFRKTLAEKSYLVVSRNDAYELEAENAVLAWFEQDEQEFKIECGNNIVEEYTEPKQHRVTCVNRVVDGPRFVYTPTLDLNKIQEYQVKDQLSVSVQLVKTGTRYGLSGAVFANEKQIFSKVAHGIFEWNKLTFKDPLQLKYRMNGNNYVFVCQDYEDGDDKPDKDLDIQCRLPLYDSLDYKKVSIANGNSVQFFSGARYYDDIQMWVSKNSTGYRLNLWNAYQGESFFDLVEQGERLLLQKEINYRFAAYYYRSLTLHCKNMDGQSQ